MAFRSFDTPLLLEHEATTSSATSGSFSCHNQEKTSPTMVFTRADGKAALTHVIENVFELPIDHPLPTALTQASIVEIGDVLCMPYDDILDLAYTDDQGNVIPVGKGDTYRL